MSDAEIIRTLEMNGVEYRRNFGCEYEMLDVWTENGVPHECWIPFIRDRITLYRWLGY